MYLEPIVSRLLNLDIVTPDNLRGCSHEEIAELEQKLRAKLPNAYKEFLRVMGKGAGQFLRGSDCFYPRIIGLGRGAIELLSENDFPTTLPDDTIVFFMHGGYQFSFFRPLEGENPPVYSYCEGQTERFFIETHPRFTGFLSTEIDIHESYLATVAVQ